MQFHLAIDFGGGCLADETASDPVTAAGAGREFLQRQNQTEVNIDTPEFAQFPNLIDDIVGSPAAKETVGVEEIRDIAEGKATTSDVRSGSTETMPTPVAAPASARSLFEWSCADTVPAVGNNTWTSPLMSAVSAGPPPL